MITQNINGTENGHSFVDLGLPSGLLWATCNVGATSPEQTGLYFAWGETVGYTAEQIARGERKFLKKTYNAKKIKIGLTLEQDAAHTYMGGKWRMTTKDEFQELIDNCNSTWTTNYNGTGVNGYVFTSNINGNSIFFPAAGYYYGSLVDGGDSYGFYWSASWFSSSDAWYLDFYPGGAYVFDSNRCYGQSVRGVCER